MKNRFKNISARLFVAAAVGIAAAVVETPARADIYSYKTVQFTNAVSGPLYDQRPGHSGRESGSDGQQ